MNATNIVDCTLDQPLWPKPSRERRAARNAWRINVLLIDDDAADTGLITDVLRRHPDVRSFVAADKADHALADLACGKLQPDMILLDIQMPKLNGFKVLEALGDIWHASDIPVFFLTTSRIAADVERAKRSAVCGYIVKPDSLNDLQIRIGDAIGQVTTGKWSR